jgi:tetratricopeptide (TPR) repeat protein
MAEDKKEFQRRFTAFHDAGVAGEWDKAVKLGEALRTEFPNSFVDDKQVKQLLATAYNNRGASYLNLKQYDKAIENFNKVIELTPDAGILIFAYSCIGACYLGLKQYERAIKDFDRTIELKSDYASAYINRGISYARMGESAPAIDDFTKAIGLQPENSSAYALRSLIYTNINKFDVAIEDIKRAISSDNNQKIYLDIFSDILQKKFNLQNNQTTEGKSEALRNERKKLFKGSFKKIFILWLGLLIIFSFFSNPQLLTLFTCSGSFDELDLNPISEFSFTAITITTIALIAPWIWQVRIATNETMVHTQAELNTNFDERFAQLGASKSFDSINMPITSISQPLDESSILNSISPQ